MANINDTIRAALDSFVEDISNLIQQAALESVEQALAGASVIPGRRGGRGTGRVVAASFVALGRGRKKGARGEAVAVEELKKKLHRYIDKNPGQRIEEIAEGRDIKRNRRVISAK